LYYETEEGRCFLREFIDSRTQTGASKNTRFIDVSGGKGPTLPRPYADLLQDGIHELRVKLSGQQTRMLYFFCYKSYIVLTHVFMKSTSKVPKMEIEKAKQYREDFLSRYTEENYGSY